MHYAILNYSGNVGKSTAANEVIAPRLKGAPIIAVESVNSDGGNHTTVRGEQFGRIQESVLTLKASITDVGASNVEDYMAGLASYHGSHEDIDVFVVPTVPDDKQMSDTISTIEALAHDIGVPSAKIRLVFNRVNPNLPVPVQFAPIFEWHAREQSFTLEREAVIHTNEIYSLVRGTNRRIKDIAEDDTDYRAQMADAASEERQRLARLISLRRLAFSVSAQHETVFRFLSR
jgi:hypothetical protein